jgi:hypothetical protein
MLVDTTVLRGSPFAGFLAKDVSVAAAIALTTDEARNSFMQFTGVKGAATVVTFPLGAQNAECYLFDNASTGAFTLTVKGSIGTGIVLTQPGRAVVVWNGSDFVQWSAAF